MKVSGIILFVLMVVQPFTTVAQSAYKGGEGDGYDMAEVAQFNVSTEDVETTLKNISVQPSILKVGQPFKVERANPDGAKQVAIQVISVQGKTIRQTQIGDPGNQLRLQAPQKPGLYFVEMAIGQRKKVTKIVVK